MARRILSVPTGLSETAATTTSPPPRPSESISKPRQISPFRCRSGLPAPTRLELARRFGLARLDDVCPQLDLPAARGRRSARGKPRYLAPTELAARASADLGTFLAGTERWRHAPVGPTLRRHLSEVAELGAESLRAAQRRSHSRRTAHARRASPENPGPHELREVSRESETDAVPTCVIGSLSAAVAASVRGTSHAFDTRHGFASGAPPGSARLRFSDRDVQRHRDRGATTESRAGMPSRTNEWRAAVLY